MRMQQDVCIAKNDCFQTGAQESINLKNFIKGIVHLKMKILSSFTLPSCWSKTVLLLCGTQNNVFLRKLATKWFWVPLTSIDKNTMGFNETKFFQNNIFCLGGLSFNICFYQLLALWNATRMCSKSPTELEKKNKTLPRKQRSNYRDCSDRRQPGRASNEPQTAILPHTKSSSLISPLISPHLILFLLLWTWTVQQQLHEGLIYCRSEAAEGGQFHALLTPRELWKCEGCDRELPRAILAPALMGKQMLTFVIYRTRFPKVSCAINLMFFCVKLQSPNVNLLPRVKTSYSHTF